MDMDAAYYRRLARELMTSAATADNPVVAARWRKRAHEYLLLADALEDSRPAQPPRSEPRRPEPQRPAQQQQQVQPKHDHDKQDEDETAC